MKTEKMSFKNIKDVLSRDEMKGIMAGSGEGSLCGVCIGYNGQKAACITQYGRCRCIATGNPNYACQAA